MRKLEGRTRRRVSVAVLAAAPLCARRRAWTHARTALVPAGRLPAGVTCQQVAANPGIVLDPSKGFPAPPAGGYTTIPTFPCQPNNVAWANMMSELGMAIAPHRVPPGADDGLRRVRAEPRGELHAHQRRRDRTDRTATTQYWHTGTQGSVDPNNQHVLGVNNYPDSHPAGLHRSRRARASPSASRSPGALGYMANTSLWVGGADVHWAILEGFRTGFLGYLPDIAVGRRRAHARRVAEVLSDDRGHRRADLQADSRSPTARCSRRTSAAQRVIIFADSTVVNLTPAVDPLAELRLPGHERPGERRTRSRQRTLYDGTPVCSTRRALPVCSEPGYDSNAERLQQPHDFKKARIHRWRGIAGVNYSTRSSTWPASSRWTSTDPSAENANLGVIGDKQWTMSFEAGVSF